MFFSIYRFVIIFLMSLSFSMGGFAQDNKNEKVNFITVVEQISVKGDALVKAYMPNNNRSIDIGDQLSDLYFDEFEASGMEMEIGLFDPKLKTSLESKFSLVIGYAMKNASKAQLEASWKDLKAQLYQTANAQNLKKDSGEASFWSVLLQSFFILLREGFEAILVITALVTYLKRSDPAKVYVIWYGVLAAFVASLATAWLLHEVIHLSGVQQEALEGVTMLIAAIVLFYVSYWLISKREADRWQNYIHGKINTAVSNGSLFTLAFAAFLAVYREGAETVLFYQALSGSIGGQYTAMFSGILIASVSLFGIYWLMYKTSVKLPLSLFFTITAILLYSLAFIFIGRGILELQEALWITTSPQQGLPHFELLGIFPTWEGFTVQLLFLLPLPISWYVLNRKKQKILNSQVV